MTKSLKIKGVSAATGVAFLQGLEGILMPLFILAFGTQVFGSVGFSGAALGAKEVLGLCFTIVILKPSTVINVIKKLRTRQGFFFTIAAALGTTTGNLSYFLAIAFAGSGYGVILTALYPVLSILLIKFFFKEKEPFMVWVGIIISTISGLLFVLLPILVDGSGSDTHDTLRRGIGMGFGLLTALFWAIEGFFIKKGMMHKQKDSFNTSEIVVTRSLVSNLTTFALVMPLLMLVKPLSPEVGNSFQLFAKIFSNPISIWIIIGISFNILILRMLHVYAISAIGPKLTAVIDTNNFLVPALMAEFLRMASGKIGSIYEGQVVDWWAFFLILPIAIGVFMTIFYHKEQDKKTPFDRGNWDIVESYDKGDKNKN